VTKPAAAVDTPEGRFYPVPKPGTGEILELPSITRIISVTDTKHLCDWNLKMATLGTAMREDLQVQIAAAHLLPAGKPRNSELRRLTMAAHESGQVVEKGHIPSDRGTGYHTLSERLDELVPPGAVRLVDELGLPRKVAEIASAYVDAMRGVLVVRSEVTVVSFIHGYAGTADRLIRFQPLDAWTNTFDQYRLGEGSFGFDNKFGVNMHPTFALQLAAIVNAEYTYDADTQTLEPLPDDLRRDVGFVFQPDRGLIPVDLEAAHEAFLACLTIHRFNDRDPLQPALASRPDNVPVATAAPMSVGAREAALDAVDAETPPPAPLHRVEAPSGDVFLTGRPDVFAGLPDENGLPQPDRRAKRDWLIGRVLALQERYGQRGLDTVATCWPVDVPTFKHTDEHTIDQLTAIEQTVITAEAELQAPLRETNDPSDLSLQRVPADDERLVACNAAIDALPRDLRERVDNELGAADIPHSRLSEADLAGLVRIVHGAVDTATERAQKIRDAFAVCAERGVTETALLDALDATPPLVADQVHTLDELADAVTANVLVERDGRLVVDQPALLLAAYGRDRRRVLAAGQAAARTRGIELPRDSDTVLAHPVLAAAIHSY
jgi:hypothetical protein